jgi:hypothetical protein
LTVEVTIVAVVTSDNTSQKPKKLLASPTDVTNFLHFLYHIIICFSWLIPTTGSPPPNEGFHPATYVIGPEVVFICKLPDFHFEF